MASRCAMSRLDIPSATSAAICRSRLVSRPDGGRPAGRRQLVGVRDRERDDQIERVVGAAAEQRGVAVVAQRVPRLLDRLLVEFLQDGVAAEPLAGPAPQRVRRPEQPGRAFASLLPDGQHGERLQAVSRADEVAEFVFLLQGAAGRGRAGLVLALEEQGHGDDDLQVAASPPLLAVAQAAQPLLAPLDGQVQLTAHQVQVAQVDVEGHQAAEVIDRAEAFAGHGPGRGRLGVAAGEGERQAQVGVTERAGQ